MESHVVTLNGIQDKIPPWTCQKL